MKRLGILVLGFSMTTQALASEPSLIPQSVSEPPMPPERRERHVVLLPTVGLWSHAFRDADFTARVGPYWGLDVKLDPFSFLNVRGGIYQGNQPLSVKGAALSADATVYQPTLDVLRMHMRLEPTWHYTEQLSLYLGLGLGWSRLVVPEPTTTPRLASVARDGVFVGYEGALGAAIEPFRDWMVVDISFGASYLANQTGSAFQKIQAFTNDGHRTSLEGLSKFGLGYRMSLGVGLVL